MFYALKFYVGKVKDGKTKHLRSGIFKKNENVDI